MSRDDAARAVVLDVLMDDRDSGCGCESCASLRARDIVVALVAAGWGDLTAERERLAAAVEAKSRSALIGFSIYLKGYGDALDAAVRLIRETPDRCPVCRHAPHASLGFCPNLASDNDCDCTVRETPEETP